MVKGRVPLILLISIFSLSCSIDYGDSILPDEMKEDIPDNILRGFLYTENSDGHKTFSLYASKAETFNTKEQTILTDVVFQQFDSTGALITEGRSDRGVIYQDNDNAEMRGNIQIYSSQEEAELSTSYLYWDNEEKTLTGKQDTAMTIKKDSGTVLSGRDFSADMRTKTYFLGNRVHGEYVYEED
ncbi:MAG: LPS export ABC transporter periplasmic protein LptC [Spirochaetes bacterium]|nr:MAG: LPS export ABC transporter periplasmic protein LptC [Spirochaetota bacterium]